MAALSAAHGVATTILSNKFIRLPVPVADLSKQIHIVTGANTGLGFESAKHLLSLTAAKVIMGVRSVDKGNTAREALLRATGRAPDSIEVWPIDMANFDSVRTFAARAAQLPRLDGLLANAGIMTTKYTSAEDNESTITVNVVGTFLLCLLLVPTLRASGITTGVTPRVVIPNSALHYMAPLKELDPAAARGIFERLNDPKEADMANRYPLSKLLVLYIVRELAQRLPGGAEKPQVIFNTPNPSFCKSDLLREDESTVARVMTKVLARTTEEGARTLVDGLIQGPKSHGQYLTNCHVQAPSSLVTCAQGRKIQVKLYDELMAKLETISPGIRASL